MKDAPRCAVRIAIVSGSEHGCGSGIVRTYVGELVVACLNRGTKVVLRLEALG